MTRDELRSHGYSLAWKKHTKRKYTIYVMRYGTGIVKLTARGENVGRIAGYNAALRHFVIERLS